MCWFFSTQVLKASRYGDKMDYRKKLRMARLLPAAFILFLLVLAWLSSGCTGTGGNGGDPTNTPVVTAVEEAAPEAQEVPEAETPAPALNATTPSETQAPTPVAQPRPPAPTGTATTTPTPQDAGGS